MLRLLILARRSLVVMDSGNIADPSGLIAISSIHVCGIDPGIKRVSGVWNVAQTENLDGSVAFFSKVIWVDGRGKIL